MITKPIASYAESKVTSVQAKSGWTSDLWLRTRCYMAWAYHSYFTISVSLIYMDLDYNSPLIYWWGYCNLSILCSDLQDFTTQLWQIPMPHSTGLQQKRVYTSLGTSSYCCLLMHIEMHFYWNGIQCVHQWMVVYALDPISIKMHTCMRRQQ